MKKRIDCYIYAGLSCVLSLLPFFLMLLAAFNKSVDIKKGDIFTNISISNLINNFSALFQNNSYVMPFINSLVIAVCSTIMTIFIASLAAYSFTILKNKIANLLFYLVDFAVLIPINAVIIPIFILIQKLNALNYLTTIIIVTMPVAFICFIIKQNANSFPIELIRAAQMDGLNEFNIFLRVFLPYLKPVLITAAIITFIDSWNSFFIPLIIIQSPDKMTLPLFLNNIGASQNADYGAFMLALFLSTIPAMILFAISQRYFKMGMKGI